MRLTRVYQNIALKEGEIIILDERASHHLSHVLRLKTGAEIVVFNGIDSGEYHATLQVEKKKVVAEIHGFEEKDIYLSPSITLIQGIPRADKMDWILQKSVELGAQIIKPMISQYSEFKRAKEYIEKKMQHWQSIVIHACEQSGRCDVPILKSPQLFTEIFEQETADLRLFLHPRMSTFSYNTEIIPQTVSLAIGPEGGFSDEEVFFAEKENFLPITLGARILRTETAAIAALTFVQTRWGEFR